MPKAIIQNISMIMVNDLNQDEIHNLWRFCNGLPLLNKFSSGTSFTIIGGDLVLAEVQEYLAKQNISVEDNLNEYKRTI